MNAVTSIARKPVTATKVAKAFTFKGKGKELRTAALQGIASLSYQEGQSRAAVIAQLALALGKSPKEDELKACQLEYVAGRIAQRMGSTDFPKADMSVAERIAFARLLVTSYAAPVKDGTKARSIKGKLGRRSVAQHKAVRAAEETWSLVKAELGIGAARTQAEKNKRSTKSNPVRGAKGAAAPTHSELVKADGPMTRAAAIEYLGGMAKTMAQFSKKHAKLLPLDYGTAVNAFAAAIAKADALVKSTADA